VILAAKALLALLIVGNSVAGVFNERAFEGAYAQWPPSGPPALSSSFAAWDAAHYLTLSEEGYKAGSPSCAFYPFWPAMIRAASFVTPGGTLPASILLANALSLGGLWMLYGLVRSRCGTAVARDALILIVASPGALFLSVPYTESLYLAVMLAFLLGLERQRYLLVCSMAFAAPLVKAIGIFLVLPFAWHLWEQRKPARHWLMLSAPVVGYALYFLAMLAWTGDCFQGFTAQKAYPNAPSVGNMLDLRSLGRAAANLGSLDGMLDSVLDRGFPLLYLAMIPLMLRLNKTWLLCSLPAAVFPACASYFVSSRRYIVLCFPLFVVLAQLLAGTKCRWLFWYYVVLLAGMQIWAVRQFSSFNWAG